MTSLTLRNYQEEGLETIKKELKNGIFRQLVVLPTGSGKTILMAAVVKHYNKKVLILAHRGELLEQAKTKIKLFWPKADIGICKAKRIELDHQIVVGSVQSCYRPKRLEQLKKQNFDILIIDEAHHAAANSYQKIIKELGFNKDKLLIGFTATPSRQDNKKLGNVFEKIIYYKSISELITDGYLSPVIGRKILTNFILKGIKSSMGDFAIGDLSEAVNTPERNEFVVSKYKTYAKERKSIAFCVDVQHCKDLAREFRKQDLKSFAVYGKMSEQGRKMILGKLRCGSVDVVTSCSLLTEGFDLPSLNAIIMARPTRSKALYTQMIGRGLRTNPGKEDCIIFDFTDKYHNLSSIISLEKAIPEAKIQTEKQEEKELVDNKPKLHIEKEVDEIFNLFGDIKFIWISIGDGERSLSDDFNNEIVISQIGKNFVASVYYNSGETKTLVSEPLPLNYCVGTCEEFARRNLKITYAAFNSQWTQKNKHLKSTPNQKAFLLRHRPYCNDMNKAEASFAIREIIALSRKEKRNNKITPAQKIILKKAGINFNNISKQRAADLITQLNNKIGVRNEKQYANY